MKSEVNRIPICADFFAAAGSPSPKRFPTRVDKPIQEQVYVRCSISMMQRELPVLKESGTMILICIKLNAIE